MFALSMQRPCNMHAKGDFNDLYLPPSPVKVKISLTDQLNCLKDDIALYLFLFLNFKIRPECFRILPCGFAVGWATSWGWGRLQCGSVCAQRAAHRTPSQCLRSEAATTMSSRHLGKTTSAPRLLTEDRRDRDLIKICFSWWIIK